ncbi:MAG: ABC transporter substrate-binding protein [Nocardioidaceae bacterium]|nr:ABC transporter substrate-binding protein [Nocardioidaceae bacterium]
MIRPTRTARLAAVAATAALMLASCAQDEGTDTTDPAESESSAEETTDGEETPTDEPTEEPTEETEPPAEATGDGKLVVGYLLPTTGDLAFLGPPEIAGVNMAVEDINAAGGVLGEEVAIVGADSGDGTPAIAPSSVDKLLSKKSDVIVGAASSSVSLSVIDKIVNAGVVHFSPANTSTAFDTYDDKDLYFRTAPSDVLQGAVMANLVIQDGKKNVAILARQDSYGEALADEVAKGLEEGGAKVAAKTLYAADASNYTAEVNQVAGTNPDAVVLIAFNETTKIIPAMIQKQIGPGDVQVYFVDGNAADYSADFDPGTLEGVKATFPGAELTGDFRQRLLETDPNLKDFTYGPETYDATVMSALAAEAAKDDAGVSIGAKLIEISAGGTKCTTFEECAPMAAAGEDIDYEGVSGPVDLNETGSPSKATIGIFEYAGDNTYAPIDYVTGVI